MIWSVLAVLASASGLGILYMNWRRRMPRSRLITWVPAWALIFVSAPLWSFAHGLEFGVCYAVIALALLAWGLIGVSAATGAAGAAGAGSSKGGNNGANKSAGGLACKSSNVVASMAALPVQSLNLRAGVQALPHQLWVFLVAVPLAGFTAIKVTVALTILLPWHAVDLMAFGIYAMPMVWGLAAFWACMDSKIWRPALCFVVMSAVAMAAVGGAV